MSARRFLLRSALMGLLFACSAVDANAQGLIRRLRNRIAPIIQNQLDRDARADDTQDDQNDAANRLPSRTDATQRNGRSRFGIDPRPATPLSPLPPVSSGRSLTPLQSTSPTPIEPRQSAGLPGGGARSGADKMKTRVFGNSILKPLGFNDDAPSSDAKPDSGQTAGAGATSLGISVAEANPGYPAVQIRSIASYSSAKNDGLRVGDYIFAIDGIPTPDFRTLASEVSRHNPGDRVVLRIGRRRQVSDLSVMLVAKPLPSSSLHGNSLPRNGSSSTPQDAADRGSTSSDYSIGNLPSPNPGLLPAPKSDQDRLSIAAPLNAPQQTAPQPNAKSKDESETESFGGAIGVRIKTVAGRRGVVITSVEPGSIAAGAGLKVDDRVVAIGSRMVSDESSFVKRLEAARGDGKTSIQVIRGNRIVNQALDFDYQEQTEQSQVASEAQSSLPSPAGIGSMFGGLFGGGSVKAKPPKKDPVTSPAEDASAEEETQQKEKIQAEIDTLKDRLKSLQQELDD